MSISGKVILKNEIDLSQLISQSLELSSYKSINYFSPFFAGDENKGVKCSIKTALGRIRIIAVSVRPFF
jgi:hypothetical protein